MSTSLLIAGRKDSLVLARQFLATASLIGTPRRAIQTAVEPCGHLSLFVGRKPLAGIWMRVADWLDREVRLNHRIGTYVPGASASAG